MERATLYQLRDIKKSWGVCVKIETTRGTAPAWASVAPEVVGVITGVEYDGVGSEVELLYSRPRVHQ